MFIKLLKFITFTSVLFLGVLALGSAASAETGSESLTSKSDVEVVNNATVVNPLKSLPIQYDYASPITGGGNKKETIYISNTTLSTVGFGTGLASAIRRAAINPVIAWGGIAVSAAGLINTYAGNNGYKITIDYVWAKRRVTMYTFEEGWMADSFSLSTY